MGVSTLEVGTHLLRGGLDCGNKIVVREGVFGDKFVGRDGMVFVVLIYVQATEGHGEKKGGTRKSSSSSGLLSLS